MSIWAVVLNAEIILYKKSNVVDSWLMFQNHYVLKVCRNLFRKFKCKLVQVIPKYI